MTEIPDSSPETGFDQLTYSEKTAYLFGEVSSLFEDPGSRTCSTNTYPSCDKVEMIIDGDAVRGTEDIFMHYLVDPADSIDIRLYLDKDVEGETRNSGVLTIGTKSNELSTGYLMWYYPGKPDGITFMKEASRVYDSPQPYKVGGFQCEGVIYETVCKEGPVNSREFAMLKDLISYLKDTN